MGWLASKNPLRWSERMDPAALARALQASADAGRQVLLEGGGGSLGPLSRDEAVGKLMATTATPEEKRARAFAAAQSRLPAFKQSAVAALQEEGPQLVKHYGSRSDGFYLRFLLFNEAFFDGAPKPEMALTMLLNYCRTPPLWSPHQSRLTPSMPGDSRVSVAYALGQASCRRSASSAGSTDSARRCCGRT
tara:strand:- start:534 stop:1106 length:573 start_codon:yes stop_codon:yes gene_type:complete